MPMKKEGVSRSRQDEQTGTGTHPFWKGENSGLYTTVPVVPMWWVRQEEGKEPYEEKEGQDTPNLAAIVNLSPPLI